MYHSANAYNQSMQQMLPARPAPTMPSNRGAMAGAQSPAPTPTPTPAPTPSPSPATPCISSAQNMLALLCAYGFKPACTTQMKFGLLGKSQDKKLPDCDDIKKSLDNQNVSKKHMGTLLSNFADCLDVDPVDSIIDEFTKDLRWVEDTLIPCLGEYADKKDDATTIRVKLNDALCSSKLDTGAFGIVRDWPWVLGLSLIALVLGLLLGGGIGMGVGRMQRK